MNNQYLKFWGVRGSRSTAESNKMEYGGDTSCIEIRTQNNELIILDMGTGLNNLGKSIIEEEKPPTTINVFLSHYHWDHILGFLTFMPIYNSKYKINIYGNNKNTSINEISKKLLDKTFWPVSIDMLKAEINFIELNNKSVNISDVKITCNEHAHPNGATSYKISCKNYDIVYTTDCEHAEDNLSKNVIEFAENADILIHDSHFTPEDLETHKGWGHSSWEQAAQVAKLAKIKKLFLFHYSPEYDDSAVKKMEENAKNVFKETYAAKQGLKYKF